jgi:hypothetical protein
LPFDSVEDFYREYTTSSLHCGNNDHVAKRTTFQKAYEEISKDEEVCRLMHCKGNFSTCGVCNSAALLLSNRSKVLKPTERNIILAYRCFGICFRLFLLCAHVNTLRGLYAVNLSILSFYTSYCTLSSRRAHLDRQKEERVNVIREKEKCKRLHSITNQPIKFFMKLDGMTARTCRTPKVGAGRKSQNDENAVMFENRIIGVEVLLGIGVLLDMNTKY